MQRQNSHCIAQKLVFTRSKMTLSPSSLKHLGTGVFCGLLQGLTNGKRREIYHYFSDVESLKKCSKKHYRKTLQQYSSTPNIISAKSLLKSEKINFESSFFSHIVEYQNRST